MVIQPHHGLTAMRVVKAARWRIPEPAEVMGSSRFFAGLTDHARISIASFALGRRFAKDELLFRQGEPVCSLILLTSGCVKHTQVSRGGAEALLRVSGRGEVVGVLSESANGHTCTVRATEECEALVWDYSRLKCLITTYPQLRNNLDRILIAQLEELEERYREVATERVARRLALVLLRLGRQIGRSCDRGIQVFLSREEFAQMSGATVFTVSRQLSRWSEQGFVITCRESVIIRDPNLLEAVDGQELAEV